MNQVQHPSWWYPKHARFRAEIRREKPNGLKVLLINNIADTIAFRKHRKEDEEWEVDYTKTIHGHHGSIRTIIYMNREEIETAFDLNDIPKREKEWCDRFGLQAGVEGCFARTGNFLSIPNPGLSQTKSTSIFILVTKEIKDAITHLINY